MLEVSCLKQEPSVRSKLKVTVQTRFQKDVHLRKPYSYGPYNRVRGKEQRIRITEGCPNNCPQCYEPTEIKVFEIPEIVRNKVSISDMNLLCKPEALSIIEDLGSRRVKNKVVEYELICGIDHRFLTQEIADALYRNRFRRMRLGWDGPYSDQIRIKKAIGMLLKAGYKRYDIMVFMVCNYRTSFEECLLKMDLCKVWNVKIADCYFDGQVMPHVIPIFWSGPEIQEFRAKTRRHNHLVNFGIDPTILKVGADSGC
jgi:hypothetical protein